MSVNIINRPQQLQHFADHVLTVVEDSPAVKVYRYAKPTSGEYALDIVCYKHYIFIGGDLGEWVFDCTWQTNLANIPVRDKRYLIGKLSRKCNGVVWDSSKCEFDLRGQFEEWSEELDLDEAEELKEIFNMLAEAGDQTEYITAVRDNTTALEELGFSDIWDSGLYMFGQMTNPQLECVLIGLELAQAALTARKAQ